MHLRPIGKGWAQARLDSLPDACKIEALAAAHARETPVYEGQGCGRKRDAWGRGVTTSLLFWRARDLPRLSKDDFQKLEQQESGRCFVT